MWNCQEGRTISPLRRPLTAYARLRRRTASASGVLCQAACRPLSVFQLTEIMLCTAADWIDCKQVMANVKEEDRCSCPRA